MRRTAAVVVALLCCSATQAETDYSALLEEAVSNVQWDFGKNWAYTETSLREDQLWVGRHDPRIGNDGGWTLLSVDGREPTSRETREFLDDKDDDDESPSKDDNRVVNMVVADSLQLVGETETHWVFSFTPSNDEISFIGGVNARLRIAKAGPHVELLELSNDGDIKPGFGTTLTRIAMHLSYGPAVEAGPIVPREVSVQVAGRALWLIAFEEVEGIRYSDFEYTGDQEPAAPVAEKSPIEALADDYLAAVLERNPAMATYYSIEGARHDRLFDNSLDAQTEWEAREDRWLAELGAIDAPTDIGSRDWVTYGILHESLESGVATRVCRSELWQASTTTAWHVSLPFLFEIQPVDTPELRQQTLDRLGQVATFIDTEIANLRLGLEMGYSAPRVTVEAVPAQVRALISDDSIFLNPATRADDEEFTAAVSAVYEEQIAPAIERFAAFIEGTYLEQAREEIALSANRDGARCYPALIRSFATVNPSPEEVHALGLEQITGIRAEYREVIDEHFGGGSIEEFLRRINIDPEFTFESEDAVLQYSVDALDAVKAAMPKAFGRLPIADVIIKPYPEFAESGVGEYHSSSEDGARPGIYYIAVTEPQKRTRAWQLSTLHHETYPGHHLQGAISLELGERVHPIARYFGNSGFSEGWALYSERLADELGLYRNPLDYIGLYSDQGARAARLVIDTGLHTKGWTRQQAVDYMMANTSWAGIDIQNDINRYISWPGQATAYMLGMLEIRRLRDLAELELGDKFDLKAFHDRVVGYGGITLPMLHVSILAWIEEQR